MREGTDILDFGFAISDCPVIPQTRGSSRVCPEKGRLYHFVPGTGLGSELPDVGISPHASGGIAANVFVNFVFYVVN